MTASSVSPQKSSQNRSLGLETPPTLPSELASLGLALHLEAVVLGLKGDYPLSRGEEPWAGLSCLSRNIRHFNQQSHITGRKTVMWLYVV